MQIFLHPVSFTGISWNNIRNKLGDNDLTVQKYIPEADRLMRMPDVINMTGLPRSTIYLKIKNNEFPQQVQISSRSVAWIESEIKSWISNSVNKRNLAKGGRHGV
ncbi:AlpA family transcriptional regulator [Pantoea sp.]|uniref:AlpA family transcriptional regulator n=1 Tax=Pantoea sp. TaxID=69393 RepID=UPI0039E3938D